MLIYSDQDLREQISALAPRVSRAVKLGYAEAQQVVRRAGSELAAMALTVIGRLGLRHARVFPTGGALALGSPVRRLFHEALRWPRTLGSASLPCRRLEARR